MIRLIRNIMSLSAVLLVICCARMGQPDGGWYDEKPPKVISAEPAERDTLVTGKKIVIRFDEYIKLDNPTEKVVISPPQLEQPEIKASGRDIYVTLQDTLRENTTYTIDFSDAISDNNEGNPMGAYTYTFSTGREIDTLEVSGYILEAETLEPVKGILVGLFPEDMAADSTRTMLRVSRSDADGHFVIRGVKEGRYQVGAVQDMDGDYRFTQRGEKMAFSTDIITPSSRPDFRQDTLWADELHIKEISRTGYTRFLPDDIVLRAFTHEATERHFLKADRTEAETFSLFFTAPSDTLPTLRGLNFDERDAFLIEASQRLDTIQYWLRDTALVHRDTLKIEMRTVETDTLGCLVPTCDTLQILSRTPYAKRLKAQKDEEKEWKKKLEKRRKRAKEGEEITDTLMPPKFLEPKYTVEQKMSPDGSAYIDFPAPLARMDTAAVHLYVEQDSLWYNSPYEMKNTGVKGSRQWELYTDWIPGAKYSLEIDSLAFEDIYGRFSDKYKQGIEVPAEDTFGTLFVAISGLMTDSADVYVSLLSSGRTVKRVKAKNSTAEFYYVSPGKYYVSAFIDRNGNGRWDTGDYYADRQPEEVYYLNEEIETRAKWDITKAWNVSSVPLNRQKPAALIKQKASSSQKKIQNRNAERARQMGIDLPDELK